MESGAKVISWGVNENRTSQKADYDYFAIWSFPDQASIENFEKIVEGAGWYNYFEQVNISGTTSTPDDIIGKLIAL